MSTVGDRMDSIYPREGLVRHKVQIDIDVNVNRNDEATSPTPASIEYPVTIGRFDEFKSELDAMLKGWELSMDQVDVLLATLYKHTRPQPSTKVERQP